MADIEATLSHNVRAHSLRYSRYRGLAKADVQPVVTALACNVARIADWMTTRRCGRGAPRCCRSGNSGVFNLRARGPAPRARSGPIPALSRRGHR